MISLGTIFIEWVSRCLCKWIIGGANYIKKYALSISQVPGTMLDTSCPGQTLLLTSDVKWVVPMAVRQGKECGTIPERGRERERSLGLKNAFLSRLLDSHLPTGSMCVVHSLPFSRAQILRSVFMKCGCWLVNISGALWLSIGQLLPDTSLVCPPGSVFLCTLSLEGKTGSCQALNSLCLARCAWQAAGIRRIQKGTKRDTVERKQVQHLPQGHFYRKLLS